MLNLIIELLLSNNHDKNDIVRKKIKKKIRGILIIHYVNLKGVIF